MTDEEPRGIRARARAELLRDVSRIARSHLAASGAAELSVRAIARELGLASSALYRYYPSRDALLTQLIIDTYDELGAAVEGAEADVDRSDVAGRFAAICHAVRDWARANPHEYALIYGSPVLGYAAPDDTIESALRVARVLIVLAADIDPSGPLLRSRAPLDPTLAEQLAGANDLAGVDADLDVLALGVELWAQLFGFVSFELFGTFHNAFDPADALFEHQVAMAIQAFGLDR
ncbi:MAG: TetR/AcrR family transcriptional regulator [Ilumatobacter sp.]|uniref:TetR/AcrR family transcriptional regulator n=1 Tax=Ilumatobacter sp. TaxID=1967498 RepID=UPI003299400D